MPNYLICSTDKDDYAHILVNLCPYFFLPNATVTVQSVNALANIEILGKDDYIIFEEDAPVDSIHVGKGQPDGPDVRHFGVPAGVEAYNSEFWFPGYTSPIVWKYEQGWKIMSENEGEDN
jgi:hypothetical protein